MATRQAEARVSGASGTLRAGYQVAATLGAWTMTLQPELPRTYRLEAAVSALDPYWIEQGPFRLTLAVGPSGWSWPLAEPSIEGGRLVADLAGAPAVDRVSVA